LIPGIKYGIDTRLTTGNIPYSKFESSFVFLSMSTSEKKLRYTFDEYLELGKEAEFKSEFYQGEIFAMSAGTGDHSLIGTNVSRELGNALMGGECLVYGSDLKIRIDAADAGVYPDGMVICGPREYYKDRKDVIINPIVVIEVLSEGTAAWDRGGKFRQYRLLPSLQEYIVIEQKEAQIDIFRKNAKGLWVLESYRGLAEKVEFQSLGVGITSSGIYHGVNFSE